MSVDPTADLLRWYDAHARSLPWRLAPGSREAPDPYRVWLAEIMLQQTTVAAAGPFFERFLARWPTVQALAAASDADLMAAWAGLGYYARARNLLAAARVVAARGDFPRTEAGLMGLPGVGAYTAAAVAAIAFGEPAVVIDANVERVASRWFAIAEPLPAAKAMLKARLQPHVPGSRPGDFAQAMMDLGATICAPRKPACAACPLAPHCVAHARATPTAFPVKPARKPRPLKQGIAWWIEQHGAVALLRRPPKGMLGGMLGLPGTAWRIGAPDEAPPFPARWQPLPAAIPHGFTHFELLLHMRIARLPAGTDAPSNLGLEWVPRAQLASIGLPTLYKKAVAAVLASEVQPCFEAA